MSIYKKISDDIKEFDTGEEFLKYYEKNQDGINAITTRALNLKYKIKGFKIGRKDGKIVLYPVEKNSDDLQKQIDELRTELERLTEIVKSLINRQKEQPSKSFSNSYSAYFNQ